MFSRRICALVLMLLMTFFFLSALLAFDPGMICQGFLLLESLCTSALFFLLSENIFDFYYNRRLGDIYIYIYLCTHSVSVYVNHEVSKNQCCSTVFAQTFASNVSRQPKPCNKAGVSHLLGDFAKFNVANMRIDPHVPVIYRVVHANGFTTSSCFQISCGRNFPTKLAGSLGRMRFVALVPARGGSDYQRMRGDTHTSWKRVTLAVPFPELRWSCAAQSNCGRLCFNSLEEHQGGLQCCCLSIQFYAAQTDITMQDVIHVRCRSSVGTKSIAFILWSMNHNT